MPRIDKMMLLKITVKAALVGGVVGVSTIANAATVPGYVSPVELERTPVYADDTRGVYVPSHEQYRMKSEAELRNYPSLAQAAPVYSPAAAYEQNIDRIAGNAASYQNEVERIATGQTNGYNRQVAQATPPAAMEEATRGQFMAPPAPMAAAPMAAAPAPMPTDGGMEVAIGQVTPQTLDMHNSLIRLREDRITVRRALQRMMDQIGGGDWAVVWDLEEQNASLPDMEISINAEEPFIDVLNALLARIQTRSGQPLRVVRYDRTQRMVITDRAGSQTVDSQSIGVEKDSKIVITESVLKESRVSLHYDEIPLVDALENMVNQSGKGEWRLRMYAGLDQVLKPAHIEEPFGIAMERLLKLFNLKYEIFPGGKLVVVTHNNRFGFKTTQ